MVNLSVPKNYTFSPSEGTPHLTINHDVAADLDSSGAFEGPEKLLEVWFAPSAATLPSGARPNGLKSVSCETWVGMLDMVNCKILSVLESEAVDAYLLSESSMFVFPHKLILKTCGTTTLLLGLQRLLHIAAADAGFPFDKAASVDDIRAAAIPYRVFYSRKNFLFPDEQRGPHRSWKQEVKYLDDSLEGGGSAYMVGKMNGDHWYLYITSPNQTLTPPLTPESEVHGQPTPEYSVASTGANTPGANLNDETLEILMTDLDPENAKQFFLSDASAVATDKMAAEARAARQAAMDSLGDLSTPPEEVDVFEIENCGDSDLDEAKAKLTSATKELTTEELTTEGHALGTVVSENCGLSQVYPTSVYPDARVDAYLFSPCGFSANGVIPAPASAETDQHNSTHYFTVHVTPEPGFSYASFETNVPSGQKGRTTAEIIEHVVDIFRPGRFSVTLFEAKGQGANPYGMGDGTLKNLAMQRLVDPVRGYRRVDRIVHDFEDYDLVFRFYEREDWLGDKSARVGEVNM
ncbi:S-adenosylmethionine decarboxylase proenzyme [Purpureocillium lilacinum]|uniref:adenosylmethionine decarboxylase n=1 Tax=Purpureocillium lilacinum TaxID=33203 RepID=A0A179GRS2_PURLI|nr:S-adenosylmethionine decarboxylase proenzyme [Purpureocillium lilacinum]OAQ75763.1 S-adenosylmethionine decarboxylase proenzyme [Purpureocillium lilacinum]OAQ80584.1 S-adenosylmethionine decarboxylase proenzyme [Purpureocillium lilacinum]GJN74940.1 spermidine resistance protein [Purpureocillium lilacinum]GJN85326.1 spermidine resistance protein [Purpureocillium lilacinum]